MLWCIILLVISSQVSGQYGPFRQSFGYVDVREGAHMFYWLFYTTADVENHANRPLIVWLQGGPGGSSTGIGNFDIMGPLDMYLQPRDYTWVNNFNVMYLDNPVGTGFSYVDNSSLLTTTNDVIALDFVNLMGGFLEQHPEFEGVPLYIYGQSYGGKMVVDIALRIHEAEKEGRIRSNLRGIGMGNAWIHPVDATLSWGPLLFAAGLVDINGYNNIQAEARETERLFNEGQFVASTARWAMTQRAVFLATGSVDFYNIMSKMPAVGPDTTRSTYELARELMMEDRSTDRQTQVNLAQLMNGDVKAALNIPEHVVWSSSSSSVFDALREDFMKPVTKEIERLLNETDIIVQKYNGNLDLICSTPGQLLWVNRLNWEGAEAFSNSPRHPIWENGRLEGYYKAHGNFRFFWINVAGHSVPRDNPDGSNAFLRDMTLTSFGGEFLKSSFLHHFAVVFFFLTFVKTNYMTL